MLAETPMNYVRKSPGPTEQQRAYEDFATTSNTVLARTAQGVQQEARKPCLCQGALTGKYRRSSPRGPLAEGGDGTPAAKYRRKGRATLLTMG